MPIYGRSYGQSRLRRPVVVFAPAAPTQAQQTITTRLAVLERRRWDRRFPLPGQTGAEQFRTGGTDEYDKLQGGVPNRLLGPRNPLVILRVPSQAQQTVKTALVRTRPRRTLPRLSKPTVLQTFAGAKVTLAHTSPRHTRWITPAVAAPSVAPVASVLQVHTVRRVTRPGRWLLAPPTVVLSLPAIPKLLTGQLVGRTSRLASYWQRQVVHILFGPMIVNPPAPAAATETVVRVHAVRRVTRPARSRLSAPAVVIPLPSLQQQTIRTKFVSRVTRLPRTRILRPPAVVLPLPTLREQTVKTRLVGRVTRSYKSILRTPRVIAPLAKPTEITVRVHLQPRVSRRHLSRLHAPMRISPHQISYLVPLYPGAVGLVPQTPSTIPLPPESTTWNCTTRTDRITSPDEVTSVCLLTLTPDTAGSLTLTPSSSGTLTLSPGSGRWPCAAQIDRVTTPTEPTSVCFPPDQDAFSLTVIDPPT